MPNLKILIVENELVVAEEMATRLSSLGYDIVGVAPTGEEAVVEGIEHQPDIVLMDINLSGVIDGIETVRQLKEKINPLVIYITDFDDADTIKRAKSTNPANYLLKPFNEKQLKTSIELALCNASSGKEAKLNDSSSEKEFFVMKDRIFVKQEQSYKRVNLEDILFIEADRAYCHLYTVAGKYTFCTSMGSLYQQIPNRSLKQVHRSYVINVDKVDTITGNELSIGQHKIAMSESYRESLLKLLPLIGAHKHAD